MSRTVIALVAGVLVALAVTYLMWWTAFYLFPPSPVLDQNPSLVRADPGRLPVMPLIFQALGQALGVFLGALWAPKLGAEAPSGSWIVGGVAAVFFTFLFVIFIPRPLWFTPLNLILSAGAAFGAGYVAALRPGRVGQPA
jgi:hypothetical protein